MFGNCKENCCASEKEYTQDTRKKLYFLKEILRLGNF